jgi:membrane fusion protein, macrolide-specific efflux system
MRTRVVLIAIVLGLAGAGIAAWRARTSEGQAWWLTAPVERGAVEVVVSALGTLKARDFVDVGAQVSGQLERLRVAEGDEVAAGDLLAELDATVLRARVEADEARVASLDAQIAERAAQLVQARAQLARERGLHPIGATSTQALETAQAQHAALAAQRAALAAQRDEAQSTLDADRANLGYARIVAPMAGTVTTVTARQGQTLNANQVTPVILQIADLSTMTVWTQVSEADVGLLVPGMPVHFTTLGGGERRWQSTLREILPAPEILNDVVLYRALVDVPNPDRALRLEMTAQVRFEVAAAQDVLRIPAAALPPAGPPRVRVLADEKVQERAIEVGLRSRQWVEVRSGLAAGEQVVVGRAPDAQAAAPRRRIGFP